jgi:hypothetical protein
MRRGPVSFCDAAFLLAGDGHLLFARLYSIHNSGEYLMQNHLKARATSPCQIGLFATQIVDCSGDIGEDALGPGKSVVKAAAESLAELLAGKQTERTDQLIAAGLRDDDADLQSLIYELEQIVKSSKGRIKAKAIEALRRTSARVLDRDQDIRAVGIARISWVGSENVYLEKDGQAYYFKPGNNDRFSIGVHDFSNETVFG